MQNRTNIIVSNAIYLYIRMVLVLIVNLYVTRIVLKNLGVEDFGIYNIVGSVVIFFSFFRGALTNATSRYLTFELGRNNKKGLQEVYSMAINCHVILSVILFLVLEFVGVWVLNTQLNIPDKRMYAANVLFQLSVLTFCISVIQTPFHSNIIAHERMNYYAALSIIEVAFKLGIAFYLADTSYDKLVVYGGLLCLSAVVVFGCYVYYCKKNILDTYYVKYWDIKYVKEFASYSGWSLLVNSADVCTQQSISIFFNMFVGLIANAALGIANQINSGLLSFSTSIAQAYQPQVVKSYAAGDMNYFYKLIFAASKISFIMMFFIAVPVVVNIDYILTIWLGEYPPIASSFVKIIMIYYLFDTFQTPLIQALYATGKIRTHQIMISCIKFMVIPLMFIELKYLGSANYALAIWAVGNIIGAIVRTLYMRKLIKLDVRQYTTDVVLKLFLIGIVILVTTSYISSLFDNGFISLIISLTYSVTLTALLALFFLFNKSEKLYLSTIPFVGSIFKKK